MSQPSGVRSGLLLALIGGLIVMRTITKDQYDRTLADRLLGKSGDGGNNPTDAQLSTLDAAGRTIAPNELAGQMGLNNARLRVQQAIRTHQPPSPADLALLRAHVPGFSLRQLIRNTLGTGPSMNPRAGRTIAGTSTRTPAVP